MGLTSKILRLSAQKLDHPQRRALVNDQQLVRVMRANGQNRLRLRAPRRYRRNPPPPPAAARFFRPMSSGLKASDEPPPTTRPSALR